MEFGSIAVFKGPSFDQIGDLGSVDDSISRISWERQPNRLV